MPTSFFFGPMRAGGSGNPMRAGGPMRARGSGNPMRAGDPGLSGCI